MGPSGKVPDAWDDDDWVSKADVSRYNRSAVSPCSQRFQDSPASALDPLPSNIKLTKAERRAKQAELNRKLWEDAWVFSIPLYPTLMFR